MLHRKLQNVVYMKKKSMFIKKKKKKKKKIGGQHRGPVHKYLCVQLVIYLIQLLRTKRTLEERDLLSSISTRKQQ